MLDTSADAIVPAPPATVFAEATRLEDADWLPAVRRLRRLDGSGAGVGARYAVEVSLLGRRLEGVLVCRELEPPTRAVYALEEGLDLTVEVTVEPVSGGSRLTLRARYSLGGRALAGAVERASSGPARREVARAVEALAARFGRPVSGSSRV